MLEVDARLAPISGRAQQFLARFGFLAWRCLPVADRDWASADGHDDLGYAKR